MPGEEDWISKPLHIVENIFAKNFHDEWEQKVFNYFREKLEKRQDLYDIPSLNCCSLHDICPNILVRYRGMIQDMFDPEYYISEFEILDQKTQQKKRTFGCYKEIIQCNDENELDLLGNVMRERRSYYCIPVPGENAWVKQMYAAKCQQHNCKEQRNSTTLKRQRESEEDEEGAIEGCSFINKNEKAEPILKSKKIRHKSCNCDENVLSMGQHENKKLSDDPLPETDNRHCIVKVYGEAKDFLLNDCYEFIGIYVCDPYLACMTELEEKMNSTFLDEEKISHCPPTSVTPRLHVVHSIKLTHNNPLLPLYPNLELSMLESKVHAIRRQLLTILEMVVMGDSLAAEYVLYHLISSVYVRKDVLALGKFCLNLSRIPEGVNFASHLYEVIETFSLQSHFFLMSLSNMNTKQLIPKKNYLKNRLETGLLQMSNKSNLVLDETALSPGQLQDQGVRNMTALGNLISWQKVAYDFNFHTMEYPVDVAVLILSQGKSILPSDCHLPLETNSTENVLSEQEGIRSHLTEDLTNTIRRYLSMLKLTDFSTTAEMFKDIEQDFVITRQTDVNQMTLDDFNWLLVLARFVSLSYGEKFISQKSWSHCKNLEMKRKKRLKEYSKKEEGL